MFLSPLKILETTLVLVLLLPAFGNSLAPAQRQDRNSIRLEVPHVTLLVSPGSVAPGRPLRFVAHLSSGYPNIRFRFAFGDGSQSQWQTSTVATHTYQTPGNYLPFVDIGVATDSGVTRLGGSPRARIQVTQTSPGGVLTNGGFRQATNSGPAIGVRTASARGGRAVASNSTRKTAVRKSATSSPHKAVAPPQSKPKIAALSPTPASSQSVPVSSPTLSASSDSFETTLPVASTERASGDWWKYLLIALPIALLAFIVGKRYLAPGPTIRTVPDPGTASVTDATGLVVDSRADLRPNVLHGEHIVSTDDASLVKNVRRENV